jgi:hypothetical protein
MQKDFDARFTHALLIAIIVLLTAHDNSAVIGGEIGRMFLAPLYICMCFAWAYFMPQLREWADRKSKSTNGQ